jgi:hypothetical protein
LVKISLCPSPQRIHKLIQKGTANKVTKATETPSDVISSLIIPIAVKESNYKRKLSTSVKPKDKQNHFLYPKA